ncbi:methyltransferase family protein [Pseudomonas sp. SJZ079]|uniref:class I SAM-dependent methyltransferase n=1 Tax=Pseudomonas sp. SJZ079 TaxID=2572887 RepID=UPI00119A055A|nr:class I SAM-dependent methyltransferase [Pseudomonas sp. SJZ079]TWC34968.1 methyltransferase family protein [Pseudomonas sp. SJZ079]
MQKFSGSCPVCGCLEFSERAVLWPELISAWQLSEVEVSYINRQQGFHCKQCFNNLRAMGLAAAIVRNYQFNETLVRFCELHHELKVLEINAAGNLTSFLSKLPLHRLVEYPQFDMLNLNVESNSFDLVVHSDTLEHVPYPERALSECHRVLRSRGRCIFTVPIVIERMTRSRVGLAPSYHGQAGVPAKDQLVHTEFGADTWQTVLNAGFSSCEIFSFEYPAALVMIAIK